ncbi:MAG: 3'-5' exonuclease [Candidatus Portnoybacteria bacterium CG23_combo_of_CG06-09_8_20_14_all_37_13]|uniref:3'-5' exonuclease n=1 Tax=Candidatus Portnoybacteria bacterium CG23_combo_of_CG06-09_8_20_14_all_37_13 TaxID=1974819 RepID=A0A2G9YCL8_9BACT|nr:MAG: 3'-5' exonuclease [Candidatus Portnoybacteria bacterium CG23_combo_of_CG06-09_8_20_14_all_37_13]
MPKLIFDIETIGEDFDSLDKATQDVLTRWLKKESKNDEEYQVRLEDIKQGLGFSALTGQIAAIGVLDYEKNQGAVLYQAPGEKIKDFEENGIKFKQMSEKEMLKNFWQGAKEYQEFISFNGRVFDAPFLMIRSAIFKIKPSVNLMPPRYANMTNHIDLLDQLTFFGASYKKGGLHLWCRAFNIESPKAQGVTGDDVALLFKQKKYLDIAKYNVRDLRATKELYDYWQKYLKF